jgi:hypothetical protein
LMTSTGFTATLTQGRSRSTNSHHLFQLCEKLSVIFELFCTSRQTFRRLFYFCYSVSRRDTNFAVTRFIVKSSVKMRWNELYDTPVISEVLSMVRPRSSRTA